MCGVRNRAAVDHEVSMEATRVRRSGLVLAGDLRWAPGPCAKPWTQRKNYALDFLAGYIVCGPGSHVFDWQSGGMTLCFNPYSWVHS